MSDPFGALPLYDLTAENIRHDIDKGRLEEAAASLRSMADVLDEQRSNKVPPADSLADAIKQARGGEAPVPFKGYA